MPLFKGATFAVDDVPTPSTADVDYLTSKSSVKYPACLLLAFVSANNFGARKRKLEDQSPDSMVEVNSKIFKHRLQVTLSLLSVKQ